jgi:excisionase family DNA binding protein
MPRAQRRSAREEISPTAALFVRIPTEQARRLDRAAFELNVPKQQLVSGLVESYVNPDSPESLVVLGERLVEQAQRRRVTLETQPGEMSVGHHSFHPREQEVLTSQQAADLLQVKCELVERLASEGELPGRRLGSEWRFTRSALLQWLAGRSDSQAQDETGQTSDDKPQARPPQTRSERG